MSGAPVYEATGSQPIEYAQLPASLTFAAPTVTHATRSLAVTAMTGDCPANRRHISTLGRDRRERVQQRTVEQTIEVQEVQYIDKVTEVAVMAQRQVPLAQRVQRTVEVPKIRDQTVEVARVIPQERIKPAGARASVRERVRQFEMNGGVSHTSTVGAPRVAPRGRQSEDPEDEAPSKRRKQENDLEPQVPVHYFLCDDSSDQEESAGESAELVSLTT